MTDLSRTPARLGALFLVASCVTTGQHPDVSPPIDLRVGSAYEEASRLELPQMAPGERTGLHNVFRLSDNIVSGSEPYGEAAFGQLREMGVKTVLSVDGKVPEAALAERYGLDYVHVPIQYRGITEDEMTRIAKTFREKPGPFYVHCFHGKHRGPAAAAVGRVVLDGVARDEAIAEMRQWCGTSPSYEGLYRVIATGAIASPEETARYRWDFPPAHPYGGYRQTMIEIVRARDNLKGLSRRGWRPDVEHPDLDALNEAEKLADTFDRANRLDEVARRPGDFRAWMDESAVLSRQLRDAIVAERAGGPVIDVDVAYAAVEQSCAACHRVYRND